MKLSQAAADQWRHRTSDSSAVPFIATRSGENATSVIATRRDLCQMCAGPPDHDEERVLRLLSGQRTAPLPGRTVVNLMESEGAWAS
ncbi:hypothetical protein AB0P17_26680 [Streptomyces sp. NPDC088124]|uniref:hypothetical protein n=1 Tax=Streptomyces sp. NPDC088124 TaxID=3154654 RepID=UPI003433A71F